MIAEDRTDLVCSVKCPQPCVVAPSYCNPLGHHPPSKRSCDRCSSLLTLQEQFRGAFVPFSSSPGQMEPLPASAVLSLSFSGFSFLPFCIPRSATCIKSQFPAGNPLFTFSSSVVLSTAVPASLKGVVWAWEVHPCSEEICMSQGLPTQGAPLSLQPSLRQTGEVVLEYALLTL